MEHISVPTLLGILAVILASAKLGGFVAEKIGQPAVLGEMVAGVILGTSVVGLVNPGNEILHFLAELGVVVLLFEIGLETDLQKLLRVGGAASVVAAAGVILPFALGYGVCYALGLDQLVSMVVAASLTATSVGITARVLSDLGRLHAKESQVVLGAAVIDDVVGLIILALVAGIIKGKGVTPAGVALTVAVAVGFLVIALLLGRWTIGPLARWLDGKSLPATTLTTLGLILVLGLAWGAAAAGSAMIIGAFVGGLILNPTPQVHAIQRGVSHLAKFFVPIFFVVVGAAVDLRLFNPVDPANRSVLWIAGLLIVVAIVGKFAAGYAPFWFRGKKSLIGVGMVPRGEVGLIFAQMGLDGKIFDAGIFSAVALMVMVTTFIAPPILKRLIAGMPDEVESPPAG